jgi:hypothetical protein
VESLTNYRCDFRLRHDECFGVVILSFNETVPLKEGVMKSLKKPLRIALVEIGGQQEFSDKIAEAAKLYHNKNNQLVDKIYLLGGDFSRLYYARRDCKYYGIPAKDVINDKPDLASFVKDCKRGVELIVVITTCLEYVKTWYRFRRMPGWVWIPVKFHIASIV